MLYIFSLVLSNSVHSTRETMELISQKPYNQLYDYNITYQCIKRLYSLVNEYAFVVRILHTEYIFNGNNTQPYYQKYEQNHKVVTLKRNNPTFEDWYNDIKKVMKTENFDSEIHEAYEMERTMYKNGIPELNAIDRNIHELFVLHMCNEKAVGRYTSFPESYKWHHTFHQLENDIVKSIKNIIHLLNNVLDNVVDTFHERVRSLDKEVKWTEHILVKFAEIQVWFDEIAAIIYNTRELIHKMRIKNDHTLCNGEIEQIYDMFKKLIESIVMVQEQPPKILKTDTYFPSAIRILLTLSNLNIKTNELKVTILSQEEVTEFTTKSKNEVKTVKIQLHEDSHDIYYQLKQLKVDKIKRLKNQQDKVVGTKYVLKFSFQFQIDNIQFGASLFSWPVFVIVHHSQEPLAKAAVMWDKHFPDVARSPNKSVPWFRMSPVLESFFKSETGCSLNVKHLAALYQKAKKDGVIDKRDNFSWTESCEDLSDSKFTFWQWFYGVMKFTREFIKELWEYDLIEGFVTEDDVYSLRNHPAGTFLLRFSESTLGGLTIVGVEYNSTQRENTIYRAGPISSEMGVIRARSPNVPAHAVIVDIIRSLKHCTRLIDGRAKDKAFGRFYIDWPNVNKGTHKSIKITFEINGMSPIQTNEIAVQTDDVYCCCNNSDSNVKKWKQKLVSRYSNGYSFVPEETETKTETAKPDIVSMDDKCKIKVVPIDKIKKIKFSHD
ncbi:signal transducer and activator of transcription 5A-like [Contarinia nasturtii]|uniref:signal transducer and activator of transcription 5A-like n=1 Tax=Contarinia nasturtii TaxID=265458 RepID=UPI0012D43283|nr:signal transducer and activator of transcription 5A-like [Contarinia nasturtii]